MSGDTIRYSTSSPVAVSKDNPLNSLIHRLEAATSRLEDIASSTQPPSSFDQQPNGSLSAASGAPASNSMPELTAASKDGSREDSTATVQPVSEPLPPRIQEMDELIGKEVADFQAAGKGLDALIEEQASSVASAFADQRRFLLTTTKAKKPDPQSSAFMDLLSDLQQDMGAVGDIRDSNRGSPVKEHLAMVGEGITALQWLVMDGKPNDYVGEVIGGAEMYGNRVLTKYRESDQAHVKYVRSYYGLLKALQAYIKKHYPTGVTWNNNGDADAVAVYRDVDSDSSSTVNGASATPSSTGAPPPPPPPLPNFDKNAPPPPPGPAPSGTKAGASDMGAVFEQLNKGESVTAGLKKVDKSQMTHKNPSLRASSSVGDGQVSGDISRSRSPGPEIKPKPPSMRQNSSASLASSQQPSQKPKPQPKKELDGNKWLLENHDSPSQPLTLDVSLTQSVLITKCRATTIILRGKANAVSIDNSPKCQILVDTLVSSVDVIKCPSFAIQITGSVPTIMLDQVDGASVFLGKESLGTEVFTSKCSGVNVVLPPEEEEGDSVEVPLPEQIRTVVKGGRLVSEIVEHAG
ncbi:suppressor of rasval19 [Saxophila tyrrhenica]|uniref:Adenylyl cyclase-associated protein n=1 Tax=Saxophila tyrrhenica TaxID=1690608 RepID=A0AAV9PNT8_9PEZI|nr:suppressor of rasval19 [Saxophila tyrrhenica]